jgi:hypothetical protein
MKETICSFMHKASFDLCNCLWCVIIYYLVIAGLQLIYTAESDDAH